MDLDKESSDNSASDAFLSYFEDSDEENVDDDYFRQYVDVGVGEVLKEVVDSSQMISIETDHPQQANAIEVREENTLAMLSDYESEDIEEVDGMSEDEDELVVAEQHPKYNPSEMCKEFKFQLGMDFTSLQQFKDAVREYALFNGYELKFVKNDKVRCRVKCAHGECKWVAFVSKGSGDDVTFRSKTLYAKHTCGVSIKGKNASYMWVSEKIVNMLKMNKNLKLQNIIASVREHYMVDLSAWKAYKARKRAKSIIEGDYKEQYHKLRDYSNEVKKCNPETTFILVTDHPYTHCPPIFRRLYECIGAVKRGFLAGCRPIIGLDGCFLKVPYGGILLVAIGRDANDQYFPLAWAVVKGENKDFWTWFLNNLFDDIGTMRERRWVFISDLQKVISGADEAKLIRGLCSCCAIQL